MYTTAQTRTFPKPYECVQRKFIGLSYPEMILQVLATDDRVWTIRDVAHKVFTPSLCLDSEMFDRAANSIGSELRAGARRKQWQKIGRGFRLNATNHLTIVKPASIAVPKVVETGKEQNIYQALVKLTEDAETEVISLGAINIQKAVDRLLEIGYQMILSIELG